MGCLQPLVRCESALERLLGRGPESLSDAELVSVVLPGSHALETALEVLAQSGSLAGLEDLDMERLLSLRGLGLAGIAVLYATLELGRRLSRLRSPQRPELKRPHQVAQYLYPRYGEGDREVLGAVYLDARQRLKCVEEYVRCPAVEQILKLALLRNASCFVLFFACPACPDPSPTLEDLRFSYRLREAGEVVGVEMLSHLILGHSGRWVSIQGAGP